jgi:phosphomannomutase
MLTASHNPAQYNGMKICGRSALPIGEATGLREIERIAGEAGGGAASARGGRESRDIVDAYVRHALGVASREIAPLHVAIDCANGMAAVRRTGAEFGVAFDGDADRAIFVDERGEPVPSDLMTGLLAASQLKRHGGGKVLYDLRSSWATADAIREAGGEPGICRVGHSFVKAQMRESAAVFAGELSGHFYFRFSDRLVADDGIAAFVALTDTLSRAKRPLSELIAPLRRYHASGEINRHVDDPRAVIEDIAREHASAREVSRLDGLLVRYDDWWFNLRPSNTEPLLRLNLEAKTQARMQSERDAMLARIGGHA